jgi:hypothetical protein
LGVCRVILRREHDDAAHRRGPLVAGPAVPHGRSGTKSCHYLTFAETWFASKQGELSDSDPFGHFLAFGIREAARRLRTGISDRFDC